MQQTGIHLLLLLLFVLVAAGADEAPEAPEAPDSDSGASQFQVAKQFVRSVQNVAAGDPSLLWASRSRKRPLPTNKFWQNFVLNRGSAPEFIHPYTIQFANSSLVIGYPKRVSSPKFVTQLHSPDLLVSSSSSIPSSSSSSISNSSSSGNYSELLDSPHLISRYDDLTVTLQFGAMQIPLLRGSPYVTFVFQQEAVPIISTPHRISNLSSNADHTKTSVFLNNNQKWVIYSSSPLHLDRRLRASSPFAGVLRVALVPTPDSEPALDSYSSCFATAARVSYESDRIMTHNYRTRNCSDLLLLGLPLHRSLIDYSATGAKLVPEISFRSIDGELQGIAGNAWSLQSKSPAGEISWHSVAGIRSPESLARLGAALASDISNLRPIDSASTYFFGKAIARAARLALIAEEVGVPELVSKVSNFLDSNLSPWFDGTLKGNAIVYDSKWGGLVSQQGAFDSGADFGLGVYNDHHYHWGYFVYAGAVLAKLDPEWGQRYRTNLYSLVGDYMSPSFRTRGKGLGNFPRTRHFDPWVMHSWAGGLTEFGDGRNQESTSEAVNAYYSAALLGRAFNDEELVRVGSAIAGFECWGAKSLWHIRSDSNLYEPEFVEGNRVNGVLWANKRDSSLWFACGESGASGECRVGIQVIPITPVTEALFEDQDYNRQLFEWVEPELASDPWKGFAYAVQAMFDPARAQGNVELLQKFDDGNSLSNMLWWIYSRPLAAAGV